VQAALIKRKKAGESKLHANSGAPLNVSSYLFSSLFPYCIVFSSKFRALWPLNVSCEMNIAEWCKALSNAGLLPE
jgi:hypothetical protein